MMENDLQLVDFQWFSASSTVIILDIVRLS